MYTTTLTSTTVTCTALGGPAYVPYVSGEPQRGLTSVRPTRQAYMSRFVEPSGSFHSVWPGPVGKSTVTGNHEGIWRDVATHSTLQPGSTEIRSSVGKQIGL